ncbi:MAG: phage virion morphogenesis protein [Arcobacter sp.]|nr:MAG: phage virion morphogenesis protein [Arcobacter sp.]
MQITLQAFGFTEAIKTLKNAQTSISDTQPLMIELSNHLYNISMDSFEDGRTPDGKAWTPLKESTLKYKSTAKMLYNEGDLQGKFIQSASKDEASVGTSATYKGFPYPVVMQFGKDDGSVPARAFMPIDSNGKLYGGVEKELQDIVIKFVESALN